MRPRTSSYRAEAAESAARSELRSSELAAERNRNRTLEVRRAHDVLIFRKQTSATKTENVFFSEKMETTFFFEKQNTKLYGGYPGKTHTYPG